MADPHRHLDANVSNPPLVPSPPPSLHAPRHRRRAGLGRGARARPRRSGLRSFEADDGAATAEAVAIPTGAKLYAAGKLYQATLPSSTPPATWGSRWTR
jgi:hypothetical protein